VRKRADRELDQEPIVLEDLVLEEDLLDDLLRAADEVRAAQLARPIEVRPQSGGRPRSRPIRFIICANGASRSGMPPMIASAIGRPSRPARTADSGAPPTAIQTGAGCCSGRG
jgi:hypothetical protein